MDRHLDRNFAKHNVVLKEFEKTTNDNFVKLNTNINAIGDRVDAVENRVSVVENVTKQVQSDTAKLSKIISDTVTGVENNVIRIEDLESDNDQTKTKMSEMKKQIAEISDKMSHVNDLVAQLESGRLGNFTDLEAPNLKDQYDLKVNFNKSKHSVGFFPVFKEHINALTSTFKCTDTDAYRISISQFLQLEMAFEESFVVNLERHYVR